MSDDESDESGGVWGSLYDRLPDAVRAYLPTVQERGAYTGPFSTFAEYHALAVGFALGPQSGDVLAAYGLGSGGGKVRRSGHLSDAWKELAYVGLGAALRVGARALGVL